MKNWFVILLVLVATLPIGVYFYTQKMKSFENEAIILPSPESQDTGPTINFEPPKQDVRRQALLVCKVVDGHVFELKLEDGSWIHAFLTVTTSADAKQKVVDLLNKATDPVVVIKRKTVDGWIVEIELTYQGKKDKISDWLKANGLVL